MSSDLAVVCSKAFGQLCQVASCVNLQVAGSGMQRAGSGEVPGAQRNLGSWSRGVPGWSQSPLSLLHGYCSVETASLSVSAMNPDSVSPPSHALCGSSGNVL